MSKGRHIGKHEAAPPLPYMAPVIAEAPLCGARRSKTSRVYCQGMAGHREDHWARGRFGQWFIWPLRSH